MAQTHKPLKALTPGELAHNYVQWAQSVKDAPGITWGIPSIDNVMIPMHPGDLVGLVARPGHCKTTMLAYLARREARKIVERGAFGKEAVVFCTWESSAEEIENFWISDGEWSSSDVAWGRVPMDIVHRKMAKRGNLPIYTIGYSVANAGKLQPRMYLPDVLAAIEGMERDFKGIKPTLLLFDYLQLIPIEGAQDRVKQVLEAPAKIKELALRIGAPAVCAVQAKREVDGRDIKIPQPGDCQWGSSIEQAMDKLFGLWRPSKTEDEGAKPVEIRGKCHPITERLLIMQMTKQRWDQARYSWALSLAPQWLKLAAIEDERAQQDEGWNDIDF